VEDAHGLGWRSATAEKSCTACDCFAGHFAVETPAQEIASGTEALLGKALSKKA